MRIFAETINKINIMETLKTCSTCKKEMPISSFGLDRRSKDGHYYSCLSCLKEKRKMNSCKKGADTILNRKQMPQKMLEQIKELDHVHSNILILALRARGYSGELQFTQKVVI